MHRLPVKTDAPLAKELIPALLSELYHLTLEPPVETGTVILEDYRGSGVNVVATRDGLRAGGDA